MSMITASTLGATSQRANAAMATLEQELNQADAILGDGDTGGMLARVLSALAGTDLAAAPDLGTAFGQLAKAAMANTGSSLGTLFATALMTFAKGSKGEQEIGWSRLAGLLAAARDAMLARGGASLGDKTVLDALDAVARSIDGLSDPVAIREAARLAAHAALTEFRGKPCKIGRARMFADKSIGIDDPGMLAFVKLVDAIAA